jgi:hypothetical protein
MSFTLPLPFMIILQNRKMHNQQKRRASLPERSARMSSQLPFAAISQPENQA